MIEFKTRHPAKTIPLNNISNTLKVKYGTSFKHNPTSIYINMKGWMFPTDVDVDFNKERKLLHKRMRTILYSTINRNIFYENVTMVDLYWSYHSKYSCKIIQVGKPTFVNLEITLKQRGSIACGEVSIDNEIKKLVKNILPLFDNHKHAKFNKTKKCVNSISIG